MPTTTIPASEPPLRPRRPIFAFLLGLLAPGLGYVYAGRPWRALGLLVLLAALLILAFFGPAAWVSRPQVRLPLYAIGAALLVGALIDQIRLAFQAKNDALRHYDQGWVYAAVLLATNVLGPVAVNLAVRAGLVASVRAFNIPAANGTYRGRNALDSAPASKHFGGLPVVA